MKTIETTAKIVADGQVTLRVPPDILPGEYKVVLIIDEQQAIEEKPTTKKERPPLNFPVHDCGPWPDNLSLRREDIYDDWGR